MCGGLFGLSRSFFLDELNGYDPELELFGGEEIELSLKAWQCFGSVEYVPCARVGHIFRDTLGKYWKPQISYVTGKSAHALRWRNQRRAVLTWMDDFGKALALPSMGGTGGRGVGDLGAAVAVREKLQCRPFSWFLREVYPELLLPGVRRWTESGGLVFPERTKIFSGYVAFVGDTNAGFFSSWSKGQQSLSSKSGAGAAPEQNRLLLCLEPEMPPLASGSIHLARPSAKGLPVGLSVCSDNFPQQGFACEGTTG